MKKVLVSLVLAGFLVGCGHHHDTYYVDANSTDVNRTTPNIDISQESVTYHEIQALNIKTGEIFDAGFIRVVKFANNETSYEIIVPSDVSVMDGTDIRYRLKNKSELFRTKDDLVKTI